RVGDVVVQVHGAEQRSVLEQHSEALAELGAVVLGHAPDVLAEDLHQPGVGFEKADDVAEHHALPGSGRPENGRDGPLGKIDVHSVEYLVRTERLTHVRQSDRVFARAWPEGMSGCGRRIAWHYALPSRRHFSCRSAG